MTLNEKLQIEAEKLAIKYNINYNVALAIICAGSETALKHVQENVFCDITKGGN